MTIEKIEETLNKGRTMESVKGVKLDFTPYLYDTIKNVTTWTCPFKDFFYDFNGTLDIAKEKVNYCTDFTTSAIFDNKKANSYINKHHQFIEISVFLSDDNIIISFYLNSKVDELKIRSRHIKHYNLELSGNDDKDLNFLISFMNALINSYGSAMEDISVEEVKREMLID